MYYNIAWTSVFRFFTVEHLCWSLPFFLIPFSIHPWEVFISTQIHILGHQLTKRKCIKASDRIGKAAEKATPPGRFPRVQCPPFSKLEDWNDDESSRVGVPPKLGQYGESSSQTNNDSTTDSHIHILVCVEEHRSWTFEEEGSRTKSAWQVNPAHQIPIMSGLHFMYEKRLCIRDLAVFVSMSEKTVNSLRSVLPRPNIFKLLSWTERRPHHEGFNAIAHYIHFLLCKHFLVILQPCLASPPFNVAQLVYV